MHLYRTYNEPRRPPRSQRDQDRHLVADHAAGEVPKAQCALINLAIEDVMAGEASSGKKCFPQTSS
jgi:hypothetical protein